MPKPSMAESCESGRRSLDPIENGPYPSPVSMESEVDIASQDDLRTRKSPRLKAKQPGQSAKKRKASVSSGGVQKAAKQRRV